MKVAQFITGFPLKKTLAFPQAGWAKSTCPSYSSTLMWQKPPHSLGSQSGRGSCGQARPQPEFPWVILPSRPTPTELPSRATASAHAVMSSPGCRERAFGPPTELGSALCQPYSRTCGGRQSPWACALLRGGSWARQRRSGSPSWSWGRLCRLWGCKSRGWGGFAQEWGGASAMLLLWACTESWALLQNRTA